MTPSCAAHPSMSPTTVAPLHAPLLPRTSLDSVSIPRSDTLTFISLLLSHLTRYHLPPHILLCFLFPFSLHLSPPLLSFSRLLLPSPRSPALDIRVELDQLVTNCYDYLALLDL